jgi:prepilin-type N-terminal cleavage/methylation domain-containing protein
MKRRGFTIIELLVVVSIIALLVGILLPAIGRARDQAKLTISFSNLKNLGVAHANYAAEWNDRQLTYVDDNIATYGATSAQAFPAYSAASGNTGEQSQHPPLILGWGYVRQGDQLGIYRYFAYRVDGNDANAGLLIPMRFGPPGYGRYFGAFRIPNGYQFSQYVSGKFYDKTFYAPKDDVAWDTVEGSQCFDAPDEFADCVPAVPGIGEIPAWSSYCLSPAAMFNPFVMQRADPDAPDTGFHFPWDIPAGFRSPAMSQCAYPSLKTHMLEHHWLQNRKQDCNPNYDVSVFGGNCEPYQFNHSWDSSPVTLFYDGHVESVGVRKAQRMDQRLQEQNGYGLWHQGTPFGQYGYLHQYGYETQANTSFHILTTDGMRGRSQKEGRCLDGARYDPTHTRTLAHLHALRTRGGRSASNET